MRKKTHTIISLSFCSLLLAGCMPHDEAGKRPIDFGNSVKQNIAAQIINPDAAAENSYPITYDGERAVRAQERYASDKVEETNIESTSSASSGK